VFFNILVAKLYIAFMIIDDIGIIFALSDDVNVAVPPAVLADLVARLQALAM